MKRLLPFLSVCAIGLIVLVPWRGNLALGVGSQPIQTESPTQTLRVLSFHDIPVEVKLDKYGVDQKSFVDMIEYLRTHGFQFISAQQLRDARNQIHPLPEKPILLTFDDAYLSFYDFVFPLLNKYKYPCVLAVVSSWIDSPPKDIPNKLMNWAQLKEVAQSPLVEIASHTHALHKGIPTNPQGNEASATDNREYTPSGQTYEAENSFRLRIRQDLSTAQKILSERLGIRARAVIWPYGRYNTPALDECQKLGFDLFFALDDQMASIAQDVISRFLIYENPTLQNFLSSLKINVAFDPSLQRIIQLDMDLIYDPDPSKIESQLGKVLDRVAELKVSTVFLQAFADPDGNGNIRSVYFPNRILPMRADLFNRVVHQLRTRAGVSVYAWMPVLSFVMPQESQNNAWRVREYNSEGMVPSSAWYQRLSPFNREAQDTIKKIYEDLAASAQIDGVVFQDDGYLNDFEDFNPAALPAYTQITGNPEKPPQELSELERQQWTELKTQKILDFTEELRQAVRVYRPNALFARTLYARVVTDKISEEWFAQNFEKTLASYDFVVVMAYPFMEEIKKPEIWLENLVETVKGYPQGVTKTIFKVQTFDWKKHGWIPSSTVNRWLRVLGAAGARHLAYYPDDFTVNQPKINVIKDMMSIRSFPFDPNLKKQPDKQDSKSGELPNAYHAGRL